MIKRLLLKCNEDIDRDSWDHPDDTYLSLCKTGVRRYFDVPEDAPEIIDETLKQKGRVYSEYRKNLPGLSELRNENANGAK